MDCILVSPFCFLWEFNESPEGVAKINSQESLWNQTDWKVVAIESQIMGMDENRSERLVSARVFDIFTSDWGIHSS